VLLILRTVRRTDGGGGGQASFKGRVGPREKNDIIASKLRRVSRTQKKTFPSQPTCIGRRAAAALSAAAGDEGDGFARVEQDALSTSLFLKGGGGH
jgi:hypothetical protein